MSAIDKVHNAFYPLTTGRLHSKYAGDGGKRLMLASSIDDPDAAKLRRIPLTGGNLQVTGLGPLGSTVWLDPKRVQEAKDRESKESALEEDAKKLAGVSGFDFIRIAWLKSLLAPLQKAKFFEDETVLVELGGYGNTKEGSEFLTSLSKNIKAGSALGSSIPGLGTVAGAAGGAVVGAIEWLVGAIGRADQRFKKYGYAVALMSKMIELIGPPPTSLVLQVGYRGGNVIQRLGTLYAIALDYYKSNPTAWDAVPAYDKAGMQAFADLLSTPQRQSAGYTPIWAEGLVRALKNTDAIDVKGADLRSYSFDENTNRLSIKAESDFMLYYQLDRWYPQLAKHPASEKGHFTPGELAVFRMDPDNGVTKTPNTTMNDTGGFVFKNTYYGRYDGKEGLVTFMPELAAYSFIAISFNKDSGLTFGPKAIS